MNQPAEGLEEFLLQLARQDSAPRAARERALLGVATASISAGLLSKTAAAYASRSSLGKATTWLAAKWLATGLGAGLLTIAAAHGVAQLTAGRAPSAPLRELERPPAAKSKRAQQSPRPGDPVEPSAASQALPEAQQPTLSAEARGALTALPASAALQEPPAASAPAPITALAQHSAEAQGTERASSLSAELSLLEQARHALAQRQSAQALRQLNEYRARFPSGTLQAEARALRVEAVAESGDTELARRLAEFFLTTDPTSPLAGRVRSIARLVSGNTPKP